MKFYKIDHDVNAAITRTGVIAYNKEAQSGGAFTKESLHGKGLLTLIRLGSILGHVKEITQEVFEEEMPKESLISDHTHKTHIEMLYLAWELAKVHNEMKEEKEKEEQQDEENIEKLLKKAKEIINPKQ